MAKRYDFTRELTLASTEDGIRLFQKPVAEVSTIRKEVKSAKEEAVNIPLSSSLMEINIEFEKESSNQFGFVIKQSEEEKTVIGYDVLEEKLFVDRTKSGDNSFSTSFPAIQEALMRLNHQRLKLQVFMDTSSIEVFANDGEIAITSLFFPSEGGKELSLFSNEGTTKVLDLTLTELDSIWK